MVTGWVRSDEELGRGVEEVTARIGVVLSTLEEEAATLTSVTGEVEGLEEEDSELAVLSGVRRERPGSRQDSTGRQMAQLLVRMLKRRDGRLRSLGGLLAKLTEYLSSLTDLGLAVNLLTKVERSTPIGQVLQILGSHWSEMFYARKIQFKAPRAPYFGHFLPFAESLWLKRLASIHRKDL